MCAPLVAVRASFDAEVTLTVDEPPISAAAQ